MKKLITLALAVLVTVSAVVAKPKMSRQELHEGCIETVENIMYNWDEDTVIYMYMLIKAYPEIFRKVTLEYLHDSMSEDKLKELKKMTGLTTEEFIDCYFQAYEDVTISWLREDLEDQGIDERDVEYMLRKGLK